jgi:hypothetical protein
MFVLHCCSCLTRFANQTAEFNQFKLMFHVLFKNGKEMEHSHFHDAVNIFCFLVFCHPEYFRLVILISDSHELDGIWLDHVTANL